MSPSVADRGDLVTIEGNGFGDSGRLEVDGIAVPSSAVRRWTNQRILIEVPDNARSGMVQLSNSGGESNRVFLTITSDVPVQRGQAAPTVREWTERAVRTGETARFVGRGFGPRSALSRIAVRSQRYSWERPGTDHLIPRWSDGEIELILPPGMPSGVYGVVINGRSTDAQVRVERSVGTAMYGEPRRYAVRYAVTAESATSAVSAVFPSVPDVSVQPREQLLRESAEPWWLIGGRGAVYAFSDPRRARSEEEAPPPQRIERAVLIDRRSVVWEFREVDEPDVLLAPSFRRAFAEWLFPNHEVPVSAEAVAELVRRQVPLDGSPREIARSVHNAVIGALEPDAAGHDDPLAALSADARGGARAYATLAAALARSAGVPARRHHGVLITDDDQGVSHTWIEFFLPGSGWVPADPALGDSMWSEAFASQRSFYGELSAASTFGRIDDRRVTFSVDGLTLPPLYPAGVNVQPERSWAPGSVRLEAPRGRLPTGLSVRWDPPSVFGSSN
jgi:transglutaminase-like putative cysteine protease